MTNQSEKLLEKGEAIEIPCLIEYERFRSDNGFAILSASLNAHSDKYTAEIEDLVDSKTKGSDYDTFTVTLGSMGEGNLVGSQCILVGDFKEHPKYGHQFQADFYYQDTPSTREGLVAYLKTLPYIKEARSNDIVKRFGIEGTLEVFKNDPERLIEIPGITRDRMNEILDKWEKDSALRELYVWLSNYDISYALGKKIYEKWGKESIEILSVDPYVLTEIRGVGFLVADAIAHKVLDEIPKHYRTRSCIQYVLTEDLYKNQNLCTPYQTLVSQVVALISECDSRMNRESNTKEYAQIIPKCIKGNLNLFQGIKDTSKQEGDKVYVYLRHVWEQETYIAENLYRYRAMNNQEDMCSDSDIQDALGDIREFTGIDLDYDDAQVEAIKSAFNNRLTVITGGGGTGKSTICRSIYYLAKEKMISIKMMSPTGKAAQVLHDKTGCHAETIHRALKMTPSNQEPNETIAERLILIDEVSMVGIDTMYAIFRALEDNPYAKIVFVGDPKQLPSVSPGNFLKDIIESEIANVITLNKIHRQSEDSYISLLADEISKGKVVDIPEEATDIKFEKTTPYKAADKIKEMLKEFLKDNDMSNLQLISPKYNGYCGVNTMNTIVQEMMAKKNEAEGEFIERPFSKVFVGDRVIQIVNNYDQMVFNGDMGTVIDLGKKVVNPDKSDQEQSYIKVRFCNDTEVIYVGDMMDQIKVAWCITVHKFQGSQSPNIILVLSNEASIMMSRELVYTGMTRAEESLTILGEEAMLKAAPMRSVLKKRNTHLRILIKEILDELKILNLLGE
jgi:exodeoxyribonuclease V alpha subunit